MDNTLKKWIIKTLIVFLLAVIFVLFVYPGQNVYFDATENPHILIQKVNRFTGNVELFTCTDGECEWQPLE